MDTPLSPLPRAPPPAVPTIEGRPHSPANVVKVSTPIQSPATPPAPDGPGAAVEALAEGGGSSGATNDGAQHDCASRAKVSDVVRDAVLEAHKPYRVVVFGAVAGHGEKISYAECEHLSNR